MDRYAFRLLDDVMHALDKDGSGDVEEEEIRETLELASGIKIEDGHQLLEAVTKAQRAQQVLLHAWWQTDVEKKLDAFVLSRYYNTWCAIDSYLLLRPWTPTETYWENQRVPPVMPKHRPNQVEEEI